MGCTLFWVKFGNAFAYFEVSVYQPDGAIIQYNINFYFDCNTRLCLKVQARENIFLHKKVSI